MITLHPSAVAKVLDDNGLLPEVERAVNSVAGGGSGGGAEESGTVPDFCKCGYCDPLPEMDDPNVTAAERKEARKCCQQKPCISRSHVVLDLCTLPHVLRSAAERRAEHLFQRATCHVNKTYRHIAYGQFVYWAHGWLGPKCRVAAPACVVGLIRRCFPDIENNPKKYTGFRFAQ